MLVSQWGKTLSINPVVRSSAAQAGAAASPTTTRRIMHRTTFFMCGSSANDLLIISLPTSCDSRANLINHDHQQLPMRVISIRALSEVLPPLSLTGRHHGVGLS